MTQNQNEPPAPAPAVALRTIAREDLMQLPIRRYEGPVCLVENDDDLKGFREDLLQETVVGFDTETRPSFRKGQSYPPSLVQIATGRSAYLFQLARRDFSGLLGPALADPRLIKSGVALADDLRCLKTLFPFQESRVVDLGVVARRFGIGQTGVRNLAGIFLGFRLPKGTRTSNWARPQLTPAQVVYAATDAWASRELYLHFQGLKLVE